MLAREAPVDHDGQGLQRIPALPRWHPARGAAFADTTTSASSSSSEAGNSELAATGAPRLFRRHLLPLREAWE